MDTIDAVRDVFREANYRRFRCNKKTHGYVSPNGQVVYLSQMQSTPPWRVAVDPRVPVGVLRSPRIELADDWSHGSNMVEFPTRRQRGQRNIPYAWRVIVSEADALLPLLRAIDGVESQLPMRQIPTQGC